MISNLRSDRAAPPDFTATAPHPTAPESRPRSCQIRPRGSARADCDWPPRLPEPTTNLYGIRSLGGVNGFRTPYFLGLYNNFIGPDDILPGWGGQTEYLASQRYLDLMGCGYIMTDKGIIVKRENALSRFMLYKNFEVLKDDAAILKRLKDADFNLRKTVILSLDPGIKSLQTAESAKDLDFEMVNSNLIKLQIETNSEAVLFFDDSYNDGWKVIINGVLRPVYRADYNFMATMIPKGKNLVVFRFRPTNMNLRLSLTGSGLFAFCVIAAVLFAKRHRRESA